MIEQQKQEFKRPLKALGPTVENAPRYSEFAAVRVVTKIVQVLAQIALQDEAARPAPTLDRVLGVVNHYKGPNVP